MQAISRLVDIGVNLTSSNFSHDLDDVVCRAEQANVTQMILIGSDLEDSKAALSIAQQNRNLVSTAGIHPHHADSYTPSTLSAIQNLVTANPDKVKSLGEMGLDFNRNYSPRDKQLQAFEAQLELAIELGLPVYLHQRDAHDEFYDMLCRYRSRLSRAVLHCFTGTKQELQAYQELDLYFGISGWLCDERRGLDLQESVKHIPLDRLMLETDAPYLLPRSIKPKPKSRRNEPANLIYVLQQLATCIGMSTEELAQITTENATRFFAL